jgi:hypothetical protein
MKPLIAKYNKRESDLVRTSNRIIEEMTDNPDFPDPPPALAELKKEVPEFQEVHTNALSGDKKQVSIKNDKKVIIMALLQVLADYVTLKSKGDRTLILTSGFYVNSETYSRSNQPPSVEILEVELGPSGEATTRAKNTTGVKAYVHQYTIAPPGVNTEWVGEGSSQSSYTFKGLASDKRYWFRVVAIGSSGERGYSPVISRVIQ